MPTLDVLAAALPQALRRNWRPIDITRIVSDSRQVQPGALFVAVPGVSVDGHAYVGAALAAGAAACVVERELPELAHTPTLIVPNAREALAWLHAVWQGFPARQLTVIGVTGTDGKTTTVRLITAMLMAAGHTVGRIDTVSAAIAGEEVPTGFHTTTPDAPEVQAYLAQMVAAGAEYAVVESTSHGLAQHRVTGCEYDMAVVTNITHEHLDYHGSQQAYREAKMMLFHALSTAYRKPDVPKVAVLNRDDASYAYLEPIAADHQWAYGLGAGADLVARDILADASGLHFTATWGDLSFTIDSPLVGRYNVHNILAAICVGLSVGLELEAIRQGIASVCGVLGRMERIDRGQPFTAVVDFCHTPNALEQALLAVRELVGERRVIVVFGCAGLRDRQKRAWMGEIAGRLANLTVITAEDPRTESLEAIMEEIASGCRQAGRTEGDGFLRVGDRGEAIATALGLARPGDLVLVTGKGHERSMCFGTVEHPWSDQDAVVEGLAGLGYYGAG
jgi:UDP-N-acetylmuramoyl-L-alanyl-D-glutamate--2,6-diaminopimelate ligase